MFAITLVTDHVINFIGWIQWWWRGPGHGSAVQKWNLTLKVRFLVGLLIVQCHVLPLKQGNQIIPYDSTLQGESSNSGSDSDAPSTSEPLSHWITKSKSCVHKLSRILPVLLMPNYNIHCTSEDRAEFVKICAHMTESLEFNVSQSNLNFYCEQKALSTCLFNIEIPTRQFWDSGGVKLESLCNFSIVGCQWTVDCLLGSFLAICSIPCMLSGNI